MRGGWGCCNVLMVVSPILNLFLLVLSCTILDGGLQALLVYDVSNSVLFIA